jgi:hypothetical protein
MPKLRPIKRPWCEAKPGDVLQVVGSYHDLVASIRGRKDSLGFSNVVLDGFAGLPDGYVSKILSTKKILGPISLDVLLSALGLKIAIIAGEAPTSPTPKNFNQDRSPRTVQHAHSAAA